MILISALLASQVPLTRRHINTLSDAEICQAFQELASRPGSRMTGNAVVHFEDWTVDCPTQTFAVEATILQPLMEPRHLQASAADALFCRRDNIRLFLARGWKVHMHARFPDGQRVTIRFCA